VIVSVEGIVPAETVRSDPSRTVVPGFRVSAVVHMPYGAHPSGLTGYYDSDYAFQARVMAGVGQNRATYESFAAEWIDGRPDRAAYIRHYRDVFGDAALELIAARSGVSPKADVRYSHATELRFRS
jgi:glutaconate CoA-transferase subunit A